MKKFLFLIIVLISLLAIGCSESVDREDPVLPVLVVSDPLWVEYYSDERISSADLLLVSEDSSASLIQRAQTYEIDDVRPLLISPLLSSILEDAWFDEIQRRVYYFLPTEAEVTLDKPNAIPIHIDILTGYFEAGQSLALAAQKGSSEDVIPVFTHEKFSQDWKQAVAAGVMDVNPDRRVIFIAFSQNEYSEYMFDEYLDGYSNAVGMFLGRSTSRGVRYWTDLGDELRYITAFSGETLERQSLGSIDFEWRTLMRLLDDSVSRGLTDPIRLPTVLK